MVPPPKHKGTEMRPTANAHRRDWLPCRCALRSSAAFFVVYSEIALAIYLAVSAIA